MVRKLFDAEKEIVLRESIISERINKLWNDMLIYEHACHKVEDIVEALSKLEIDGDKLDLYLVEDYNLTELIAEENLDGKKTYLNLRYKFNPKCIDNDYLSEEKFQKLEGFIVNTLTQYNLRKVEIEDAYNDLFVNEDDSEEACIVVEISFDFIRYED